jgi:hypothetical protein
MPDSLLLGFDMVGQSCTGFLLSACAAPVSQSGSEWPVWQPEDQLPRQLCAGPRSDQLGQLNQFLCRPRGLVSCTFVGTQRCAAEPRLDIYHGHVLVSRHRIVAKSEFLLTTFIKVLCRPRRKNDRGKLQDGSKGGCSGTARAQEVQLRLPRRPSRLLLRLLPRPLRSRRLLPF